MNRLQLACRLLAATIIGAILLADAAQSAVVATDAFNYPDGTLSDQDGGTGAWSTRWIGFGFNVAGGKVDGVNSMPANENFIRRNFANSLATSTMFVGFDLRTPPEITLDGFGGVHLGDSLNGYSLTLGKLPGSNEFYVGSSDGSYASSGITVQPNTTYRLLGSYEVGTRLTSLWINPDSADYFTPGTGANSADANRVHTGMSHAATVNLETSRPGYKFDNLVLSDTPQGAGLRIAPPPPIFVAERMNTATPIPDGTGNFSGFVGQPAISVDRLAFVGFGGDGGAGVYARTSAGSSAIRIADTSTAVPSGSGHFVTFPSSPSVSGDRVTFVAFGDDGGAGVYGRSGTDAPVIQIANTSTAVPGGSGHFMSFPSSPTISGDRVTFVAFGSDGGAGVYARVGVFSAAVGPSIRLADTGMDIPGGNGTFTGFVGSPAISGDNVAFVATGSGGQQGVYRVGAVCPPIKVADTSTMIPGSSEPFQTFESVAMDRSVIGADLAFVGGGTIGGVPAKGVYVAQSGPPIKVADLFTTIPSGVGLFTNFTGLAFDPDVHGNAITAFVGFGAAGQQGVYAQFDGALRKVVDLDDVLDGKTPVSFSLGTSGLDRGELTFAAEFTDGSEGLFTSALPLIAAADFDEDYGVDGNDLTQWIDGFGTTSNATHMLGDADGDKDVDGNDFLIWQRQLGTSSSAAAAATIPEPRAFVLALVALAAPIRRRRMP